MGLREHKKTIRIVSAVMIGIFAISMLVTGILFLKNNEPVQFEKPLTNFFRKMVEITNTDINDINSLIVTLNRPLALTQQNLVEQISNKTEIAQFLTNNVLGENETDAVLKDKVNKNNIDGSVWKRPNSPFWRRFR